MTNDVKARLESARNATQEKFNSSKAASLGSEKYELNVVPSPSLMLDYKLGIGGFPYGHMVEVFGANQLGKTSVLGYGTLANVQRQNKLPALICMEPNFDPDWAFKLHGLDPDLILLNRPDNAEEAFEMLHDLVYGGLVDYILLDSIGAMAATSETEEGGKKKAYGVSGVVTSGLNAIMPRLYKNNQGLMIVNQVRQAGNMNGHTLHESPGGEALKHHASIRIHLKPGRERFTDKIDGEDVMVGRELICTFKKNRMAQASNKAARFSFFNILSDKYGILGIDKTKDIVDTSVVAGVIEKAGAWYKHPGFPSGNTQGVKGVMKIIEKKPEIVGTIRDEVISAMLAEEIAIGEKDE